MSIEAKVTGNLTSDPTKRTVKVSGEDRTVVEFRVFSDVYKQVGDDLVQDDDKSDGIDVSIWIDRLGDQVFALLKKGARVRVHGDMHLHRYIDRENKPQAGNRMVASTVDLVLTRIESITFKKSRAQREAEGQSDAVPA